MTGDGICLGLPMMKTICAERWPKLIYLQRTDPRYNRLAVS